MEYTYTIPNPPKDGITQVVFNPEKIASYDLLLVSSWDATLSLYEIYSENQYNKRRMKISLPRPILTCCYGGSLQDISKIYTGGLDQQVHIYDLQKEQLNPTKLDYSAPISCLAYSFDYQYLVVGGWTNEVYVYDMKQKHSQSIQKWKYNGKILALDINKEYLAVHTMEMKYYIYDLKRLEEPFIEKNSPLKYQVRSIKFLPDNSGITLASIEGRVAIEYFDTNSRKSYSFKCHRNKETDLLTNEVKTFIYPVNAVVYHPVYHTFATGGCDGVVNIWDGDSKKRINQIKKFPTSIAALDFNIEGTKLAIASSYTFEEGEKDHPEDMIYIRDVSPNEVRPKAKTIQP